ncbi:Gfo/Idh/MocA family oxidoreductase, partial [bacterium]
MTETRVGLVGCGFMGRMHSEVYSTLEGVTLVRAVDKDPAKAEEIAKAHGGQGGTSFEDLLADASVDVIDICLPTDLHADFTIRALQGGKHVVCEKPMALTLEESDAMIAAADTAGKRLMIAHCIRFWPEYVELERIVKSGELGGLLSLNLTRYGAFPAWSSDNWLADEARSGGGALDMHVHDSDYALYLMGREPDKMVSHGTVDVRGVSQIFTTMVFGPTVVHAEGGWNLPGSAPFKMAFRAIFEGGAVLFDGGPLTIYPADGEPRTPEMTKMAAAAGGNIS